MKTYKFENATIYVYGEVNKELLKNATIKLFKDYRKYKVEQEANKRCLQK